MARRRVRRAGAVALPWIGKALDRYGVRRTMVVIGAVLGAVLLALSFVSSVVGLTAGFVGLRMAGQGALSLTATTAVALWFERRRGTAIGLVSAVGAVGISTTPLLLERVLADLGWRAAWRIEGIAVWLVVIPIALVAMRDRPADLGQRPDGPVAAGTDRGPVDAVTGLTRAQAVRHPYFWLIGTAVAVNGLLVTAVAFHQISLLTARGPVLVASAVPPLLVAAWAVVAREPAPGTRDAAMPRLPHQPREPHRAPEAGPDGAPHGGPHGGPR